MGSYPNYSCSATDCSLAAVASSTAYPTTMLAVAKTTTIISLSGDPVADDDDPVTGGVAPAPIGEQ